MRENVYALVSEFLAFGGDDRSTYWRRESEFVASKTKRRELRTILSDG